MALATARSSLHVDGAGGNSEVDVCFSPLLTSLFTDAGRGKGKGEGMALPTAPKLHPQVWTVQEETMKPIYASLPYWHHCLQVQVHAEVRLQL